ncbi:hypothetical protein [Pseudanabaena sp. PCC 6802]|uniref:hypothetical protein n=1 Tax=Pseudanabaena sp. PCC 6802 TaxID=118173 RepID=UPI00034B59B3|nr:hypothetical protein [Pseudanabaena sp. PCC 6802]
MAEGICLYGGRKKAGAPDEFSVDTGVGCYLFGLEHYFCKYLDAVFLEKGTALKSIIQKLIKKVVKDVIDGNINTAKFCETPPSIEFSEINYVDVFLCFYYGNCLVLQQKIAELYRYQKWYEYCECIPNKPDTTPPTPDPNEPDLPPNPPPPLGGCGACFNYWLSVFETQTAQNVQKLNNYRDFSISQGFESRIRKTYRSFPEPPAPGSSRWLRLTCSGENATNCTCWYRIISDVGGFVECRPPGTQAWGGCPVAPTDGNYSSQTILRSYYSWRETGCFDNTPPQGPIEIPDNFPNFCKQFPYLCKKKKRNPKCCNCCNSQWLKNPNGLYLPSRYKI